MSRLPSRKHSFGSLPSQPGFTWNTRQQWVDGQQDKFAAHKWRDGEQLPNSVSIETIIQPTDKYDIQTFANEAPERFHELVSHLSPRDQEIMLCFALLQKRPTDLSILFGKAGHRAEEDLHKAAHKLAGLVAFGTQPEIPILHAVLQRHNLETFGSHNLAACLWQYARCRDFAEMSKLLGHNGLRQKMFNTFKILHAAEGREEGLLAGWILWLVAHANEHGKGWRKRKRGSRQHKLGPTVFRTEGNVTDQLQASRAASQRGGRAQRPCNVKIQRRMKFLRRMNG